MKANLDPEKDESFDKLVQQWKVSTPLPPRFQEHVWHRIARAEAQVLPTPGLSARFARWLEVALPRPKVAFAYITTLLVLGIAAGTLTAQVKSSHLDVSLSTRYLNSVSPYQTEDPHP